jgi:type I restriction enzyme, S subunit
MIDELPQGWTTAPLDSLCERLRGVSYQRDEGSTVAKTGYVPILRANNINGDRLKFDDLIWVPKSRVSEKQKIRKGDVVIAMSSGSKSVVGKTAQSLEDWEGSFGAFCGVLRVSPELNNRFVSLFLRTREYRSKISELAAGTNINNLKSEHFAQIEVPLAPLGEQRRIVAKLEKLMEKVDACQQRLAKIPVLLKRFRQSVLAAACSGRLTADWREKNPHIQSVPDVLQAHAQRTKGRERNTRRMKPAKGLTLLDYSEEFPTAWAWLKVRELVEKGAIFDVQDGNHGELYPRAEDFGNAGVRYISAEHVINDRVQIDSAPFLKNEKAQQLRIGFAKANDVILTHNATVGRVALLPPGAPDVVLSTSTTYYRVDEAVLLARYLATFLRSHYFQSQLEAVMEQTTRNQVSVTKQVEFGIAVPPLAEQQEIVRRVEALFALAEQIEARYAKAKAHVEKLTQSILAKAFRAELVPQDPNEEPASVLLERIKKNRSKSDHARKGLALRTS